MILKEKTYQSTRPLQLLFIAASILVLCAFLFGSRSDTPTEVSNINPSTFNAQKFELKIPDVNFKRIEQKRAEALERGLLFNSAEDLVDGSLRIGGDTKAIKLRLKGDLLDHIKGEKWSYRIQLKNGQEWNRMQVFSIHNSAARSHLAEWLILRLFREEGIIAPTYDFIDVEENGIAKGVYAYEQFFDHLLLRENQRSIGPILKHADDAYWENVQKELSPFYWTDVADIELMNGGSKDNPSFIVSFEQAKSKLHAFLTDRASVSEVFDLEQMAKYYALMELSHAYHAQQVTNIRFYYNPLTAKLEPIAFDCFGTELPQVTKDWSAAAEAQNKYSKPRKDYPYGGVYFFKLFQDREMTARYLYYLHQYSSPDFIQGVAAKWQEELVQREAFIQADTSYTDYRFSFDQLFKKASWTREKLLPLPAYSLKIQTPEASRKQIICSGYHYFPMEIVGLGNESLVEKFDRPLYLEAYHPDHPPDAKRIQNPNNYRRVFYKTIGIDSIFSEEINRLSLQPKKPDLIDSDLSGLQDNPCINISENTITFKACSNTSINRTVIIPKGYTVKIAAGTNLKLKEGANLISHSAIQAKGTLEQPIRIVGSSDNGILLTKTEGYSLWSNVEISELGSINSGQYQSDASVTIYDSTIKLEQVDIQHSESIVSMALHNSDFDIRDLTIHNFPGNGLEINFGVGTIDRLDIRNSGVDGLIVNDTTFDLSNARLNNLKGTAIKAKNLEASTFNSLDIQSCYRALQIAESDLLVDGLSLNKLKEGVHVKQQDETTALVFSNANYSDVTYPHLIGIDDFMYWNGHKKRSK